MMPSLFLSHGTPALAVEDNSYTCFLKDYAAQLNRPKAILIFSAHWESNKQSITAGNEHGVIYDFADFPDELYNIKYPAPGNLTLSDRLLTMLAKNGILGELDEKRCLDHGAWVPLHIMYPDADIPVIALSVNPELSYRSQYEIGKALKLLRSEDILIVGSGGIVHNIEQVRKGMNITEGWAFEFEEWVESRIMNNELELLFNYHEEAPFSADAVPTKEHLIPLFIAMGAGDETNPPKLLHRSFQHGNLSLTSWEF